MRAWLAVLVLSLLWVSIACSARGSGGDDDDDSVGGDSGVDPCPESLCCVGKNCPGGFMCDTTRNVCVSDPCGGSECCDDRPCGDGLECVAGGCVPLSTLGTPCTSDGDCNGPNAQCLFSTEGWPDGYCIQSCVDGTECPGDGVCVGASCFDGCFVPGDCRLGYECIEVPGGMSCSPQ